MNRTINIIISNNENSKHIEVNPTEYLIVDLTSYKGDLDDINVETEGNRLITSAFQPITTEVLSSQPIKKPWDFT